MSGISIKIKIIGGILSIVMLFMLVIIYPIIAIQDSANHIILSKGIVQHSQNLILGVSGFFDATKDYINRDDKEGYVSEWASSLYEVQEALDGLRILDFNSYSTSIIATEIALGEKIAEDLILNHDLLLLASSEKRKASLYNKEQLYIKSIDEIQGKIKISLYELIDDANKDFTNSINNQKKSLGLSQIFVAIFILISAAIAVLISGSITEPVLRLVEATKRIKEHKFGTYLKISSNDEIGVLTNSFNTMSKELEKSESDINTKIEELKNEKNKLETTLNSIGDAAFAVDEKGKIVFINEMTENLSSNKGEKLLGKNYKDLLTIIVEKEDGKKIDVIEKVLKEGKKLSTSEKVFLFYKGEKKLPISQSAAPIRGINNEITGCIVIFNDLTELHEVDKMKSEFISIASHQLRTPISAMKWFTEILLEGDAGELNERQKELLQGSYDSMIRMTDLINALLNISRIESEKMSINVKTVYLDEFFKEIHEKFQKQIFDKQIQFNYKNKHDDLEIDTDKSILKEIIVNLITNAIKFTPEGGKVDIVVKLTEGGIRFTIKDSGYGIPQKQQKDIFTKFTRGENIVKIDTEGKGLGLYISKKLAKLINGSLEFTSEEDSGSEFCLTLPLVGDLKSKKGKKIIYTKL